MVPLQQEIEFIRMYLQIQKIRFKNKLMYEFKINVKDSYKIMPLLIQPIVENAFIHGTEMKLGESKIGISVYETNNFLIIDVEDNGVGISSQRLSVLRQILSKSQCGNSENIGLKNIEQRIKLYYGDSYGILIESEENVRTKVSLQLPKGGGI